MTYFVNNEIGVDVLMKDFKSYVVTLTAKTSPKHALFLVFNGIFIVCMTMEECIKK